MLHLTTGRWVSRLGETVVAQTVLGKILQPLGCYQSNRAYVAPVYQSLDKLKRALYAVEESACCLRYMLRELSRGEQQELIREALVFFHAPQPATVMAEVKQRVVAQQTLQQALQGIDQPRLCAEIVALIDEQLSLLRQQAEQLLTDVRELAADVNRKAAELDSARVRWRWRERLGTPEAVADCKRRVAIAQTRAIDLQLLLLELQQTLQHHR
jgi:hypothetical protein